MWGSLGREKNMDLAVMLPPNPLVGLQALIWAAAAGSDLHLLNRCRDGWCLPWGNAIFKLFFIVVVIVTVPKLCGTFITYFS